jgi:hypothetical protein
MSEPRVIQADYANWRTVAGRKVLQLVFEVPIEQTADVMEKLGVPMPGESKWCAIALLENGACAGGNSDGKPRNAPKPSSASEPQNEQNGPTPTPINARTVTAGTSPKAGEDRRPFSALPLSQQAALRCNDLEFQLFASLQPGASERGDIVNFVRSYCGIKSRSELDEQEPDGSSPERRRWQDLESKFQAWRTDRQFASVRHG